MTSLRCKREDGIVACRVLLKVCGWLRVLGSLGGAVGEKSGRLYGTGLEASRELSKGSSIISGSGSYFLFP